MPTTLRKFLEQHTSSFVDEDLQKRARKMLVEMDDGSAPVPADMPMDDPAEGGAAEDALWSGFQGAISTFLEDYKAGKIDAPSAVKEIGKYIKAHAKLTTGKGDEKSDAPAADAPPDSSKEGKNKVAVLPAPWDVLTECQKVQYAPGASELKALALMSDPADRAAFITEQKAKKPAETPSSAGRQPGSGGVRRTSEAKTDPSVPTDKKKFLESITD